MGIHMSKLRWISSCLFVLPCACSPAGSKIALVSKGLSWYLRKFSPVASARFFCVKKFGPGRVAEKHVWESRAFSVARCACSKKGPAQTVRGGSRLFSSRGTKVSFAALSLLLFWSKPRAQAAVPSMAQA